MRHMPIRIRKPRPAHQQLARLGDHRVAVINRPPRLITEQIGKDVTDVERPRTLRHKPLAYLMLPKRKMACAWVKNQIDPVPRQLPPRPIPNPGVLTNLIAD